MKQIEIFKTGIHKEPEASRIAKFLLKHFPHYRVSFDLEDCDHILRIETTNNDIDRKQIEQMIIKQGYTCCHLL